MTCKLINYMQLKKNITKCFQVSKLITDGKHELGLFW